MFRTLLNSRLRFQQISRKILWMGHCSFILRLQPIKEEGCAVLRSGGGSLVGCGSANGMVALRDIRTPGSAEHTFRAHSACLSDLDMQGDLLITCGFTQT